MRRRMRLVVVVVVVVVVGEVGGGKGWRERKGCLCGFHVEETESPPPAGVTKAGFRCE